MAVSKVILNGDTLIDVTQKTVNSNNLLYGETALKNDGTGVTGSIATKTSSDLSASGDTVSVPAGYYASSASKAVASGTEGTPVATKGTVSSHSVTVTPSVTNVAGYISGGSKTGTAVTVSASELVSGTKSISANGTGIDVTDYAAVDVAVSANLQAKTNIDPTTSSQTIYPDTASQPILSIADGTTVQGRNDGVIFVFDGRPSSYGTYHFKGTVEFESGSTVSIDEDWEYTGNADYFSNYTVTGSTPVSEVYMLMGNWLAIIWEGSYIESSATADGVLGIYDVPYRPTSYDGLSSVQINAMPTGTAGTPVATKGTVSNHSIAVTPSVTNTTGYITGSTISGTAATVSASELVSGTKSITSNGTNIDVTDYAAVDVSVSGGVTVDPLNVTSNGTYTAQTGHAYSPVTVSVGGEDPDAVLFYDYDGTVVYRYSKTQFNALTEMPSNPTHAGLTSQGWNWSLSDAKAHLVNHSQLDIGQCYITTDGKTKLHITLTSDDLDVTFNFYHSKTDLSIDWGDGTTSEPFTNTGSKSLTHTYSAAGNYVISVDCPTGYWYTTQGYIRGVSTSINISNLPCFNNTAILKGINIGSGFEHRATYTLSNNATMEFVTIPSSFSFGSYSYFLSGCCLLKQITIPSGTSTLQTYFVENCVSLKSISLPNGLTRISTASLNGLKSIERLPIPDSVTTIDANTLTYMYCLKSIEYPPNITSARSIGYGTSLKTITVPNGVTAYGGNASYGYGIESVSLPSTLTSLEYGAFYYNTSLKSITLPSGLTTIAGGVFYGCTNITSLTIPSTVTSIGGSAFFGMNNLKSLTISSNVTEIESSTFRDCFSLEDLSLPTGIKLKSNNATYAFYNCKSLRRISIGVGGTALPSNTFYCCYNLIDYTIPSTVTEIGDSAFYNCYKLPAITIPSSVTTIGSSAFYDCHSLSSVTIPAAVTSIKSNAFCYCYNLIEIHLLPTNPPTLANNNAFTGLPSTCVIYVPSASLDAYKTATNWSTYASKMVGE